MNEDKIKKSLQNGNFVFWEEVARDGAQAKTILRAKERVEIANLQSEIFGENASDHLVFAAGFISIGKEEESVIRYMTEHVNECNLAVNCRSVKREIENAISAIEKAKYPRVAFVFPASERLCNLMLHKSLDEAFLSSIEFAKYALDTAQGIPVDIQLAGAFDSEPEKIAELSSKLTEIGISVCHLGDTRGKLYPKEVKFFSQRLKKASSKETLYGTHFHNDLGFAVANNIESIKEGINLSATSWLGLAERNGLAKTELLTFLLAHEPEKLFDRLNIKGEELFKSTLDLKMLNEIAQKVSKYTNVPLKVTDAIVGTGVNTISTGTPFVDTVSFQPFDSKKVLGVNQKIYVTQLASKRVIQEVSKNMGFNLSNKQIERVLDIVKLKPYQTGRAIFPRTELFDIFTKLTNSE